MVHFRVECFNVEGEETPRNFFLAGRQVAVLEVLDRWPAIDHRYFKIQGDNGGLYILRHDVAADFWEIIFFEEQRNFGAS